MSAFLKLREAGPSFLLESADQGRVGRYSFIGFRPRKVVRWSLGEPGDPYALLAEELRRFRPAPVPGLPPFAGGAVGVFAYDLVRTVEPLGKPNPDPLGVPDLAVMLTDTLVVYDHLGRTVTVLANVYADDDLEASYKRAADAIEEVRWRLAGPVPRPARPPVSGRVVPEFTPNMSREQFEAMVARIIEYIYAGDAYQVVPSQRWTAPVPIEAFSLYRGLRAVNPSPYMYFLDFGDFEVAGASPEPLITVAGRRVSTRPIAGTRPRGGSAEEDRAMAEELLADPKERAEHVMLVDLGRNDLGRVCEYGSVKVEDFMAVENYSHVMHIVSSVTGILREGVGALDALRADAPRRNAVRRAEGARDADHRRARAGQARRLRRRDRLGQLRRRPRHLHPHPHGRDQGRRRPRAGRRRHRRRRQARLRVPRVTGQGARGDASGRTRGRPADPSSRRHQCAVTRPERPRARRVLVLDNYDSFTYNLVQYLGELGAEIEVVRNDHATVDELLVRRL